MTIDVLGIGFCVAILLAFFKPMPKETFLQKFAKTPSSCSVIEKLAEQELQAGRLRIFVLLDLQSDTTKMPYSFYKKLEVEHGVRPIPIFTLCGVLPKEQCFNERMMVALRAKLGDAYLSQLWDELKIAETRNANPE